MAEQELADQVQGGEVINDAPIPEPPADLVDAPVKDASEKTEKPAKGQSIRDALNSAVEKAKKDETGRLHAKDGKFVPKDKAVEAKAPVELPKTEKDVQPKEPSTAPIGPPPGWSAESKAVFATLPDPVKQDIIKREKEVSDGFKSKSDEIKRYSEVDQVVAPLRPLFQQMGISEAEGLRRLTSWESALRNPATRMQAYQALGQQYGINLNSPQSEAPAIPDQLRPVYDQFGNLTNQISSIQGELQRSREERVSETLAAFSRDKPHFEKVRVRMGQLIQAGAVPPNDLDSAYQQAIWADPEIRAALIKEQTEKQAAEQLKANQQRAQNAKAAAISPSSRSPNGAVVNGAEKSGRKSIRETLNSAIRELQDNRA